MAVFISQEALQVCLKQAERAFPEECCGILLGHADAGNRVVKAVAAVPNAVPLQERAHRFAIRADDYRKCQNRARLQDLEIIGFYHSHPGAAAVPSALDLAWAWPWFVYLIVSVAGKSAHALAAWQLREDRRAFVPRTVVQGCP